MDEAIELLTSKVDRVTKLVAIAVVAEKTQGEQIALLSKAGFQPKEIAELIGTTPNTVRVALSTMRKAKKRKRQKVKKGE